MMWLKSCPRCRGDLYAAEDRYGRYIACAQCGHTLTHAQERALAQRLAARRLGEAQPAQRIAASG